MMYVLVPSLRVFVSLTQLVPEGPVFTLNLTGLLQMCVYRSRLACVVVTPFKNFWDPVSEQEFNPYNTRAGSLDPSWWFGEPVRNHCSWPSSRYCDTRADVGNGRKGRDDHCQYHVVRPTIIPPFLGSEPLVYPQAGSSGNSYWRQTHLLRFLRGNEF